MSRRPAFWIGIPFGLLAIVVLMLIDTEQFFRSYLFAYLCWIELSLGCLAMLMVGWLSGGDWARLTRPYFVAGASTFWMMTLLFVPLAFGVPSLYPWAQSQATHAAHYLNLPFFFVRALIYFVLWIGLALLASRERWGKIISGPGLFMYALASAFASFDWMMSLTQGWHSSIFPFTFVAAHGYVAMAFILLLWGWLRNPVSRLPDLSNLMLTFVLVWAYVNFMQYLVIWAGNIPDEVKWYYRRTHEGWQWLAFTGVFIHFAAAFVVLLFRWVKFRPHLMGAFGTGLLFVHFIWVFWLIAPNFNLELTLTWMDVLLPVAVGLSWGGSYFLALQRKEVRNAP